MIARNGKLSHADAVVLVVVVFTLGGIAIPFLASQRQHAQRMKCGYNLKVLGDGIQAYHDKMPKGERYLPPSFIAENFATWVVLTAPYMTREHPLHSWQLNMPYAEQATEVREAVLAEMYCPARSRTALLSIVGDGPDRHLSGAGGDYGAVAGNGQTDWIGPDANGPMIAAVVTQKKGNEILRWRGRVGFDSLKRGRSYTLLLGEKHIPRGDFGRAASGDGSVYNGQHPANFARVAGPGFALAADPESPFNRNFGSAHSGICQFLYADLSVRALATNISEQVIGELTLRE